MAFNGDGPHTKRQRTETDSTNNRGHTGNYTTAEEPRRKRQDESKPNHVLLFTIINPMYPITVDVLHTICQASGQVLRIVIFKKNGVQAMAGFYLLLVHCHFGSVQTLTQFSFLNIVVPEMGADVCYDLVIKVIIAPFGYKKISFPSCSGCLVESAVRAKETLNGADIYSGCCTLKIDFAKPEKLNVHKNDSESWDYTVSMSKCSRSFIFTSSIDVYHSVSPL
ncbi:hypothetical protein Zmor_002094 [Zophobas morio]|uniref:PTBP1-like RNA recognition motif 2 domain-containing protein n=1 Tax=Zophobas morio TaxID=2755281 RepID=A0AA38JAP8_9CUCU|nr:hypothetical protein Zmor_002094 [Zophobas morio]